MSAFAQFSSPCHKNYGVVGRARALVNPLCADSGPKVQFQARRRYFPFRPGRDRQIVYSHYFSSFFSSTNHFANTRRDTLFEVPPSGAPLKTVILTVRSP